MLARQLSLALRRRHASSSSSQPTAAALLSSRHQSTTSEATTTTKSEQSPPADKPDWLTRLLRGRPTNVEHYGKQAHSSLGTKKLVYELQRHRVRPDRVDAYIDACSSFVAAINETDEINRELVGAWRVSVGGDQDEMLHLWRHRAGYAGIDADSRRLVGEAGIAKIEREMSAQLRKRVNHYMLSFSFWGDPVSRIQEATTEGEHSMLYEIRSYQLEPGSMHEWSNHWARAIHIRKRDSEAVGGFFTQIGDMYHVHHLWAYRSFESRRVSRDNAWQYPGWDECVAATVPLIRDMRTRIMEPLPFSPLR